MTMDAKAVDQQVTCPKIKEKAEACGGRIRVKAILETEKQGEYLDKIITACGWIRTVRKQGGGQFCFVELSDGSTPSTLQLIVDQVIPSYQQLIKTTVGASIKCVGTLVKSPATAKQGVEVSVKDPSKHSITIYGDADAATYPLSKKEHSKEFLREIAHLRTRTTFIGAIVRIRSQLAMATHRFFQERGFLYVHTPIITAADCEGAGELFQVTTLLDKKISNIPVDPKKRDCIDYSKDFFAKPAFLTVSGQLTVETHCCALGDVYTFGPTFRAEKSHTSRHLSEFWMIEPELAFADLEDNMECAESYLKYCIEWALINCASEISYFDKHTEEGLEERLRSVLVHPFHRITYTDAVKAIQEHPKEFSTVPEWGDDLGSEHERYLTEKLYKRPVIVYDYPKDLKAFYMKQNEDGKTVRAMDILLPKVGEVIGGSQREESLEKLETLITEKKLSVDDYTWYCDLRRYGTIPHSGFGLGFERLLMTTTGVENIRDVIPFPRYPSHAEF